MYSIIYEIFYKFYFQLINSTVEFYSSIQIQLDQKNKIQKSRKKSCYEV